jgi:hypothetical protein
MEFLPEITQFSESERLIVLESEDIKQYRTSLKKNDCEFLKLPKLSWKTINIALGHYF